MGLQWSDVDFQRMTITVSHTSQYLPNRGIYISDTKNKSSQRIVFISQQVIDLLQEQKSWQALVCKQDGKKTPCDHVITNEDGTPMNPERLTHWFGKFIKTTDLPPIHIHSLRHTYATLCIANGIPLTTVAAQLGHATVATTANIYAHAINSSQANAANTIGQLFESMP